MTELTLGSLLPMVVVEQYFTVWRNLVTTKEGPTVLEQLQKFNSQAECYTNKKNSASTARSVNAETATQQSPLAVLDADLKIGMLRVDCVTREMALLFKNLVGPKGRAFYCELIKFNKEKPCWVEIKKKGPTLVEKLTVEVMSRKAVSDFDFWGFSCPEGGEFNKPHLNQPMKLAIDYAEKSVLLKIYSVGEKNNASGVQNELGHNCWFINHHAARALIATLITNQMFPGEKGPLQLDGKRNLFYLAFGGSVHCLILVSHESKGWQYTTSHPGSIAVQPEDKIFSLK